jgi:hypothetical protein
MDFYINFAVEQTIHTPFKTKPAMKQKIFEYRFEFFTSSFMIMGLMLVRIRKRSDQTSKNATAVDYAAP